MQKISQLFTNWIDLIHKIVPEHNPHFNLTSGISEMEIDAHKTLENGIEVPIELIQLYKTYNVKENGVTSAFSFTTENGGWYQLIPFEKIQQEWEGIQDLYFEDALEEGNLDNFDPKVKADDYANPRWIPFADGDNGDYLLFDTDPSNEGTYGQIIELINESWERIVIADSIEELIESQIEKVNKREPKDFFDFILGKGNSNNSEFPPHFELKNLLQTIKYSQIKDRMPEDSWTHQEYNRNPENAPNILYFDGDLEIDYIDLSQPLIEYEKRNEDYETYLKEQSSFMIFIDGDLKANNIFASNDDYAMSLVVTGDINVNNMIVGGGEIVVMQDLNVKDLLWGHYNHGNLVVECEIFARLILMTEEYGFDEEANSYQSEYYFNEESESYEEDIEQFLEFSDVMFYPEYLLNDTEAVLKDSYEDIYGWAEIINRDSIIDALKENKAILQEKFNYEGEEKEAKSAFLKLKDTYKKIGAQACPKLASDKKTTLYKIIDGLEIEDEDNLDYTEIFEEIYDKTSSADIDFILYFDVKSEARDVLFNIKNALKNNFEIENPALPKSEDYAGKTYVLEDVLFDVELALIKIDSIYQNGYKLTYIDIESDGYFVILHDDMYKYDVKSLLNKIGFESRINEKETLLENDHSAVPILFPNKNFTSKNDLKIQTENYQKVFENYNQYEVYYDEVELDLSKIGVKVFVNKAHKRESDAKDIDQSIYFLMDNGAEIFVWIPKTNFISGLFKDKNSIEVLYKNVNKSIFQFRSIFDISDAEQEIFSFNFAWQEFLYTIERSTYYYAQLFQTATSERIQRIINLPVVQAKYNDFEDSDKMPWLGDYNFAFDWSEEKYVTFRLSEEIPSEEDFDCCRFYFDAFYDTSCRFRYNSSQLGNTDDFYSNKYTAIQFLDYPLLKKAERLFREGEKLILDDNKKYENEEKSALAQAEKEFKNLENRIANYQVKKPFETIEIEGITFSLKDRKEAAELLKVCTDFDGVEFYDTFDMAYIDEDDDEKSFFLVAEQEAVAEKLYLDTYPPERDNCYILGYVFLKPLKIEKYIECFDLDFSPALICIDDATITSLMLSGNTHYFHKNLSTTTLLGEYNHGNLIVKGAVNAELIIADDFGMQFNEVSMYASISDDRDIQIKHDISGCNLDADEEMNYLPAMSQFENCIKDEYIFLDEERNEYKLKGAIHDNRADSVENDFNLYELLKEGKSLIDFEKLNQINTNYITHFNEKAKNLFHQNEILKALPQNEIHYEYPNEHYKHIFYFYKEDENFYIMGYWNTWFHISIVVCVHKSGQQDLHLCTVYYWNEENTKVRYEYTNELTENTYYNFICQRVYFEAINQLSK